MYVTSELSSPVPETNFTCCENPGPQIESLPAAVVKVKSAPSAGSCSAARLVSLAAVI